MQGIASTDNKHNLDCQSNTCMFKDFYTVVKGFNANWARPNVSQKVIHAM